MGQDDEEDASIEAEYDCDWTLAVLEKSESKSDLSTEAGSDSESHESDDEESTVVFYLAEGTKLVSYE